MRIRRSEPAPPAAPVCRLNADAEDQASSPKRLRQVSSSRSCTSACFCMYAAKNGQMGMIFSPRSRAASKPARSEEHTSELQSRENLVCRLLLEKKKKPRPKRAPGKA